MAHTSGVILDSSMTNKDDWFRSQGWTQADQDIFNEKIARARSNSRKQQYARIKAFALIDSKESAKLQAAVELLQRALQEWPDDPLWDSESYAALGDAFCGLGDYDAASQAYETSITWDPRVHHLGYWHYPQMIVEQALTDKYDQAIATVDKYVTNNDLVFQTQKFIYHAVRAIVLESRNQHTEAKTEAAAALECVSVDRSGFSRHPDVGLVDNNKYTKLIERLESIT